MKRTALVLGLVLAALAMTACPPATGGDPVDPDPSIALTVVDSVNGTGVSGVSVVVTDQAGAQLMSATTNASGYASIIVDPLERVTITANKSGCAESVLIMNAGADGVIVNKALVLQKLGMVTRVAAAPIITAVEVARDSEALEIREPLDGTTAMSTEGETYILVTVHGASAVEPTAWSGFGVKMGIDIGADTFNGMEGYLIDGPTLLASGTHAGMYESLYLFDLSDMEYNAGEHAMNLVAYDVANNRTEIVQPITFLANSSVTAEALTGCLFDDVNADLRAYGLSRQYFGKDTGASTQAMAVYDGKSTTYRTNITFKFTKADGTTHQPIRGFRVYRSTDGVAFKLAGTMNFGGLQVSADDNPGTPAVNESKSHSYFDTDSMLKPGVVYYYQIEAFTDAANALRSGSVGAKVYQPFTASLVGPANRGEVTVDPDNWVGPAYSFSISNTSLWSAAQSDFFYFTLMVRNKTGDLVYLGMFRRNFATGNWEFSPDTESWYAFVEELGAYGAPFDSNDSYFTYSNGTITFALDGLATFVGTNLLGPTVAYNPGQTYEWDIIGTTELISTDNPCWFEKAYTGGVAKSYGDAYSEGANTLNGRFEFVAVAP